MAVGSCLFRLRLSSIAMGLFFLLLRTRITLFGRSRWILWPRLRTGGKDRLHRENALRRRLGGRECWGPSTAQNDSLRASFCSAQDDATRRVAAPLTCFMAEPTILASMKWGKSKGD